MMDYFGHSENDDGSGARERLADHLTYTAARAKGYAAALGFQTEAEIAGLLHDLGKYAHQFQRRLVNPRDEAGRDHWSAGACLAAKCYKGRGVAAALAIVASARGVTMRRRRPSPDITLPERCGIRK